VYIIFIGGREVRQKDDTANLNDPNIYIRDVVVIFKLFRWGLPPSKKNFTLHSVTAQALRSHIYVFIFALVVY